MSRQAGSDQRQVVVNSLEFAREGGRRAGEVPVAALDRLADALVDTTGTLAWDLLGLRDADGESWLVLRVAGVLNLRCQRCLGSLPFPVAIERRLLLVPPGAPWPEDELEDPSVDDGSDAIEADRELAVLALVEEEVLLALPIAPRHESCEPPRAVVKEQEPSPFAVLAKLKH